MKRFLSLLIIYEYALIVSKTITKFSQAAAVISYMALVIKKQQQVLYIFIIYDIKSRKHFPKK